jgi:hypothetical protein
VALSPENFQQLFRRLADIDLLGSGPPDVPWGTEKPDPKTVRATIDPVVNRLPLVYQGTYTYPLTENLNYLLAQIRPNNVDELGILECVTAAIYHHGAEEIDEELDRFLAVISNFYRSFLDAHRRLAADVPPVQQLPPLAMFQHDGRGGPFTIPVDSVQSLFGGSVGVVSLPSALRRHPLLWTSLAHETGGHDVLHADADLLLNLQAAVLDAFGSSLDASGELTGEQLLGPVWSYWIDEAASDVLGVLNMGPGFALNLGVYFAAWSDRLNPTGKPILAHWNVCSGFPETTRNWLGVHPPQILRPYIAKGAVEALRGLSEDRRKQYADDMVRLTSLTGAEDQAHIILAGIGDTPLDTRWHVAERVPMKVMQASAERVGGLIAAGMFGALGGEDGHSLQDLETWDDVDEDIALGIADNLKANRSVAHHGDDAALLAGANIAAFDQPDAYDTITAQLNEALSASFATDPFWGWEQRIHSVIPATLSLAPDIVERDFDRR